MLKREIDCVFFARIDSPELVNQVSFYAEDLTALRTCLDSVVVATRYRDFMRLRPSVIYVWWWSWALPLVLLGRIARVPVIVTGVFNWDPEGATPSSWHRRGPLKRFALSMAARLATLNLFISRYEETAVAEALDLRSDQHAYFPCVVRPPASEKSRVSTELVQGPYLLNIAWSGRGNLTRKCVFEVISAFELVSDSFPELSLVLVGNEGDGFGDLSSRVASSTVAHRIRLMGRVSEDIKDELLMNAACYVSPSLYEGFGVAIAEAAATGTPVITSDVGAVREVLQGNAIFVDGRRPEAVADAIRQVLTGGRRHHMATHARQSVLRFSEERKVRELSGHLLRLGVPTRSGA